MKVTNANLHASIILEIDGVLVYFDPIFINPSSKTHIHGIEKIMDRPADVICISHDHFDHYDQKAVSSLIKSDTVIIAPTSCAQIARNHKCAVLKEPGDVLTIKGLKIECLHAYNTTKRFHPKSEKYLGFFVSGKTESFYFPGDTEEIPELSVLKGRDFVACVPVEGIYTMNPMEAGKMAKDIGAKVTIPMHFLGQNPEELVSKVRAAGAPNVILVKDKPVEIK